MSFLWVGIVLNIEVGAAAASDVPSLGFRKLAMAWNGGGCVILLFEEESWLF